MKIRQIFGLIIFLIAIIMLVWGERRFPRQIISVPIILAPGEHIGSSNILVLDAPTRIRTGDPDYIQLKILPDGLEEGTSYTPNNEGKNQNEGFADIYSTHNLLAETRLELDGMLFDLTGNIVIPFRPDQMLSIYWNVQPEKSGVYQGVVWLHFQYVAKNGSETLRKMVSRQSFAMTSVNFVGLRGDMARFAGGIGILVGLALDIDLWVAMYHKFKERQRELIHA